MEMLKDKTDYSIGRPLVKGNFEPFSDSCSTGGKCLL